MQIMSISLRYLPALEVAGASLVVKDLWMTGVAVMEFGSFT